MRARVLVVSPLPPRLDARSGGGRVVANVLTRLAESHELALVYLRAEDEPPADEAVARACAVLEEVGRRPIGRSPRRAWREWRRVVLVLRRAPAWTVGTSVAELRRRIRDVAATFGPDVVQIEFGVLAPYVGVVPREVSARILVEHDPGLAGKAHGEFDAVVAFTERDREAIAATRGQTPVTVIPIGLEPPERPLDPLGTGERVLFVGNFTHPPNVAAARRLVGGIFPRVRRSRPDAELFLVGDGPPPGPAGSLAGGVTLTGAVPSVEPYLDAAAVVVAPLHEGGGMRVKVLEALAAGKALVASSLAVEGLALADGREYRRAEDDAEFAAAIVGLLEDPRARAELAGRARAWATANLSWEPTVAGFLDLYARLLVR